VLSVVILVVDNFCIDADEPKRDPPIAADPHRPSTLAGALEGVEPKAGKAHVLCRYRCIETTKNQSQSFRVRGLDAGLGPGLEELRQALVLEAADHSLQCNL